MGVLTEAKQSHNVRRKFDDLADEWSGFYNAASRRECRTFNQYDIYVRRENALEMLGFQSNRPIIDLGAGTGSFLLAYQECFGVQDRYFANMDFAKAMLQRQTRESYQVLPGRTQGDLRAIPFRDGSAGAVVCLGVLEYIPMSEEVLCEIFRVLTSGGVLVLSIPNSNSIFRRIDKRQWRPLRWLFARATPFLWLKNKLRKRSVSPQKGTVGPQYDHYEFNIDQFSDLLHECGFVVEEVRYNRFFYTVLNAQVLSIFFDRIFSALARLLPNVKRHGMTVVIRAKKRRF